MQPCQRRPRSRGGGGGTLRFPECPFPTWAVAGASAGVVASSPPPPSWRQGPTMMRTKTVTSLSRRCGRRRGEDGKLRSLLLGSATAEGPPACCGGTLRATAAGLLVACSSEGDHPVHHSHVRQYVHRGEEGRGSNAGEHISCQALAPSSFAHTSV
jgi:hypothetical protein